MRSYFQLSYTNQNGITETHNFTTMRMAEHAGQSALKGMYSIHPQAAKCDSYTITAMSPAGAVFRFTLGG